MPKKLNFLGGMQNYNAENGQYEPALVGGNGQPLQKGDADNKKQASSIKKDDKKPKKFDVSKYKDVKKTPYGFIYNVGNKSITDLKEQKKSMGEKVDPNKEYGFSVTDDFGDETVYETFNKAYESVKGKDKSDSEKKLLNETEVQKELFKSFKKPEEKAKTLDDYTDELLKKTGLKTFTSKKYKNKDNEIVEIRRFGEGKHAIRYNQTKDIVEQVWYNGEKIK